MTGTPIPVPGYEHLQPPPDAATMDAYLTNQRNIVEQAQTKEAAAARIMERMDHKDAHYEHVGQVALGETRNVVHRDEGGYPPGGRTILEKRRDRRAEELGAKYVHERAFQDMHAGNIRMLNGMTKREKKRAIRKVKRLSKGQHWSAQRTQREILRVKAVTPVHKRSNQTVKDRARKASIQKFYNKHTVRHNANSPRRNRKRNDAIGRIQEAHAAAEAAQRNIDALT